MGGAVTATSRHPGIVNVSFADGSVKAVKGTINPHIAALEWQKSKINIIDTSGQGDFLVDSIIALGAADAALSVIGATDGV